MDNKSKMSAAFSMAQSSISKKKGYEFGSGFDKIRSFIERGSSRIQSDLREVGNLTSDFNGLNQFSKIRKQASNKRNTVAASMSKPKPFSGRGTRGRFVGHDFGGYETGFDIKNYFKERQKLTDSLHTQKPPVQVEVDTSIEAPVDINGELPGFQEPGSGIGEQYTNVHQGSDGNTYGVGPDGVMTKLEDGSSSVDVMPMPDDDGGHIYELPPPIDDKIVDVMPMPDDDGGHVYELPPPDDGLTIEYKPLPHPDKPVIFIDPNIEAPIDEIQAEHPAIVGPEFGAPPPVLIAEEQMAPVDTLGSQGMMTHDSEPGSGGDVVFDSIVRELPIIDENPKEVFELPPPIDEVITVKELPFDNEIGFNPLPPPIEEEITAKEILYDDNGNLKPVADHNGEQYTNVHQGSDGSTYGVGPDGVMTKLEDGSSRNT